MPAMTWSIWSAIALRPVCGSVSVAPCTTSSRACWARSVIEPSVVSVTVIQLCASCTLRSCCLMPARSVRSDIARAVAYGSSDGFVICLPDDICRRVASWRLATSLMSDSSDRVIMLLVMRVLGATLKTDPSGTVDQRVEHLVGGRHRARRGLVGALEADDVRHLLVERDAGDAVAAAAQVVGERLGRRLLAVGLRHLVAHAGDELAVAAVGGAAAEGGGPERDAFVRRAADAARQRRDVDRRLVERDLRQARGAGAEREEARAGGRVDAVDRARERLRERREVGLVGGDRTWRPAHVDQSAELSLARRRAVWEGAGGHRRRARRVVRV